MVLLLFAANNVNYDSMSQGLVVIDALTCLT